VILPQKVSCPRENSSVSELLSHKIDHTEHHGPGEDRAGGLEEQKGGEG